MTRAEDGKLQSHLEWPYAVADTGGGGGGGANPAYAPPN